MVWIMTDATATDARRPLDVVTGAPSGIGMALADEFVAEGRTSPAML